MPEYIDKEALKNDLLSRGFYPAIVKCALEQAPVVDAVEVVRCKDCVRASPISNGLFRCNYHTVHTITKSSILNTAPDHYCSWGIRREKNEADFLTE